MYLQIAGYTDEFDDRWINTEQVVEIHYNRQEQRYDIAMVSQRYIEVVEPQAITAVDMLVGRSTHDAATTYET